MTPRDIVNKTVEFSGPPRICRQMWTLPWASMHYPRQMAEIRSRFPDDIVGAPQCLKTPAQTEGDPCAVGNYRDEWGCLFTNVQAGVIGEIKTPLIADWNDLEKLREPVELLSVDRDQVNAFCRQTDRWVHSSSTVRPWERVQFIRGTENAMMDLALEEPGFFELLRRVHEFGLKELSIWAQTDVDGLVFIDDWGTQRSLLIAPEMWRRVFKPMYKDYIDLAHSHGKKIFMHSDGYIVDIMPDLIELGLDAINSQIFCMGVEEVGNKFRGQITFWGEMDRQHVLVESTPDEVAAQVRRLYQALYHNGGVIAQLEFGPGAKPENVAAAFAEWDRISGSLPGRS